MADYIVQEPARTEDGQFIVTALETSSHPSSSLVTTPLPFTIGFRAFFM